MLSPEEASLLYYYYSETRAGRAYRDRHISRSVDNITHSLAGLLLADAAVQLRARTAPAGDATGSTGFATVAAVTGVVGANLPDSDVLWIAMLQGLGRLDALGALLHHRGYTHTLLAALIWIPLLSGAAILGWRRMRPDAIPPVQRNSDPRWLVLLSGVAVLSHILLDATNDYGVHPLSPFAHQWMYGDSVFIIEPWLWVMAIPALLRNNGRRASRIALMVLLALGLGLSWVVPQVPLAAALIASAAAAAWIWMARRATPSAAAAAGIGGWIAVTASFALGTGAARAQVLQRATFDLPGGASGGDAFTLHDVIVSASPANPLCARVITIDASRTRYRLTTAWASAAPPLLSAAWCAGAAHADSAAGAQHLGMRRATAPASSAVQWGWTWDAPRAELATLATNSCHVAGWLRFARAPFWSALGPDSISVGDLRYDRDRGVSVARFDFPRHASDCPGSPASWIPPRHDVWPELTSSLPSPHDE